MKETFKVDGYVFKYYPEIERYTASFVGSDGIGYEEIISKAVYEEYRGILRESERVDAETRRKMEFFELSDNNLHKRAKYKSKTIFEILEHEENMRRIEKVVSTLTVIQKQRFEKYFYDEKTYKQIATEENCTYQAIEASMKWILKKFKKFF
jgi:RNA polymerase sigma-70 factor (ECF subfamily)